MLQVLTFLRSDCELRIGDQLTPCFVVLPSQLEVVLKENRTHIPHKYAHQLLTAYPHLAVSGTPKEFLRPGSTLLYIPGGRKARLKDALHTVYRKALCTSKDGFDGSTTALLEEGTITLPLNIAVTILYGVYK